MSQLERTLLRLHVEAVWNIHAPALTYKLIAEVEGIHQPDWRLCIADLSGQHAYIWRSDVPTTARHQLARQGELILTLPAEAVVGPDVSREVALHQVQQPATTMPSIARQLHTQDQALIEAFEPHSSDYYFHPNRGPLIGVVVEGQLLTIAHSSRRTAEACELGINTLPHARRHGYALASTLLWAQIVAQSGLVPIYSALLTNIASLHLAATAGYQPFAHIATLL